ncbi:MAG: sulfite exporter TauE/SafE family protein, partial [Acidobacteriota bacterium]|nr:sulfite exporter TauE/SafE family protein [Acidobacteriota bacterium]
ITFITTEFLRHPGNIVWHLVLLMALSAMAGGFFGAHMAHRVGRRTVRIAVVTIGFALSAWYFYKHHSA